MRQGQVQFVDEQRLERRQAAGVEIHAEVRDAEEPECLQAGSDALAGSGGGFRKHAGGSGHRQLEGSFEYSASTWMSYPGCWDKVRHMRQLA